MKEEEKIKVQNLNTVTGISHGQKSHDVYVQPCTFQNNMRIFRNISNESRDLMLRDLNCNCEIALVNLQFRSCTQKSTSAQLVKTNLLAF